MLDQNRVDEEHLKLLAIFHFVVAGFSFLGIGFLGLHYMLMQTVFTNPEIMKNAHGDFRPDQFLHLFRWFYVAMGFLLILASAGNLFSGLFLRQKRNRTFSLVVAALDCLQVPLGTVLGVFTFIVLLRPSVTDAYRARELAPTS